MSHKIQFEDKELSAMHETELFHVKYIVMDKVAHLFGAASNDLKKVIHQYHLPDEVTERRARIFRGENYKQLPYIVMDYPALFGKEDSFAYRTMYWWGNFFSFTLQLQGIYLEKYSEHLQSHVHMLKEKDFYFCVNSTPWQYHYDNDNYLSLDELLSGEEHNIEKQIHERKFIKLNRQIKISEWKKTSETCAETFEFIMAVAGVKKK